MGAETFAQCRLEWSNGCATRVRVSYIPSKFAKLGAHLRLKRKDGTWEDGWFVVHVGGSMRADDLVEFRTAYRRQRQASDLARGFKR